MKVSLVKIQNILGVSELEFAPGRVTEIKGRNESGKTSILEAIRAVTKGSADAELLRKGEEKGEVVLVLEDGTEMGRSFSPSGSAPFVRQGDLKATRPAQWISGISSAFAANPVEFLTASGKQRTDILLESMPIKVDYKALKKIAGGDVNVDANEGLAALDAISAEIYDERKAVNRQHKEKQATVDRLSASLPAESIDVARLKKERKENATEQEKVQADCERQITNLRSAEFEANSKLDAEIKSLREKIAELEKQANDNARAMERKASELKADFKEETGELRQRAAVLDEQIEAAAREGNTREFIEAEKADAEKLAAESAALTERLGALAEYKTKLLEKLPVKGVAIEGGEIHLDGIAFDRCSTSRKIGLAVEIAKMNAGELGLVCVDGLEQLDAEHYDGLIKAAEASDVQLICTRVVDADLKVETH